MKKILAFGASTSKKSINKQLATFASSQLKGMEIKLIDLNDFDMPIYSVDKEAADGIPDAAKRFKDLVKGADGILISFAEHNGSYSAAFKNIFDWASRVEKSMWQDKPMFLLATSPGPRGGQTVLATATGRFPFMGGKVVAQFSLPSFGDNFNPKGGITNAELMTQFEGQLALFVEAVG